MEGAIRGFEWNSGEGGNVEHIATHDVTPEDVIGVYENAQRFFINRRGNASHLMIGPNLQGRYLAAAIVETWTEGIWLVATAHWLEQRRGERLYNR